MEKNYIEKYAIIFAQKIEIKEQPNLRSDNILQLHKGSKVKVIDEFNEEWSKIKLANGQEGWIQNNEIKIKKDNPLCVLIGPEGDFSEKERKEILNLKNTKSIKINKNILRSETAAVSIISIISFKILSQ